MRSCQSLAMPCDHLDSIPATMGSPTYAKLWSAFVPDSHVFSTSEHHFGTEHHCNILLETGTTLGLSTYIACSPRKVAATYMRNTAALHESFPATLQQLRGQLYCSLQSSNLPAGFSAAFSTGAYVIGALAAMNAFGKERNFFHFGTYAR